MADHICKYEHIPQQITHDLINDVLKLHMKMFIQVVTKKVEFQYFTKNKYINCQTAVVRFT